MIKIFLLVLFSLTFAFGEEEHVECPEADTSYGGDYFQYVPYVVSWEDCGRICALTTACNFWSWSTNTFNCFLYETITDGILDDILISGERGCPEDQDCNFC